MDFSIIDELYDIYKNEHITYAEDMFKEYYSKYEYNGDKDFIKTIEEYIKQQTTSVSSYFISDKDEKYEEHNLVNDFIIACNSLTIPVDYVLSDIVNQHDDIYERDSNAIGTMRITKPHDLFKIDFELIKEAMEKYGESYIEDYNKVKNLIQYVRDNKILKKIYKGNSWYDLTFEEVMYSLYDFIEDKSVFKTDLAPSADIEFFLFEKIKTNCSSLLSEAFDKFRPNLNSKKQMRTDFSKLIFCKNLLLFYKTGIMPDYNGFIDLTVDDVEHIHLLDNFKKLYSKKHNEEKFRKKQENFICNPEVYCDNYKLEAKKSARIDDKLIVGFIVSCSDRFEYVKNDYLIHLQLNDVNNSCSNYEMQISIIPHGNLNYRLQLMRLDNWENEQPHKNIAKKLKTKTHIHLYNEFDLLRGKTNGAFDIAYNIEAGSTEFEKSLRTFLKILDLDVDISKEIYNTAINAITKCRNNEKLKEI